ncbi:SAM-dependent methyltransferase [Rubritepida flocculans]|uniref:SAM-dependent methyltransferase n=1 Tax=Rubritepida flocculans TaxID=182403 RepID=UPI0004050ED1|nr:cyclopropane-fatty-acyl-phospholipid synthase family protein [Rubritepida flocculans]
MLETVLRRFIRQGSLLVRWPDGREARFGDGEGPGGGLWLRTPRAVRRLLLDPALALGELYMDGEVEPIEGSLHDLLMVLTLNQAEGDPGLGAVMERLRRGLRRLAQFNPAGRARRNVAHHYDLDARVYRRFLDADMQYSCAYFPTGRETLEEAQRAKKRHIAAKLRLDRPGLEVLDIGSGWGGLALHLAREHGARVTGITLSQEQLEAARARAEAEGLSGRVRFELLDYRAWDRPVDRIVSVGMVEHVGLNHFRSYFGAIARWLREDGVALVHGIGRSGGPGTTNPWLAKYIFPGGYSPALSEVVPAVERSGLWITDIEVLRLHYAMTIAEWRARFAAHRDEIRALHDERFCRMFEFYLSGCECAFRHGGHMVWQMQLARRVDALPLTRDYMAEAERALA